jgi:hypothetical protein
MKNECKGDEMENSQLHEEIAEFLNSIGWKSPNDAQWTNLRDALPKLGEIISAMRSRADFEAHFKLNEYQKLRYSVGDYRIGDYRDSSIQDKWEGWQAAKGEGE